MRNQAGSSAIQRHPAADRSMHAATRDGRTRYGAPYPPESVRQAGNLAIRPAVPGHRLHHTGRTIRLPHHAGTASFQYPPAATRAGLPRCVGNWRARSLRAPAQIVAEVQPAAFAARTPACDHSVDLNCAQHLGSAVHRKAAAGATAEASFSAIEPDFLAVPRRYWQRHNSPPRWIHLRPIQQISYLSYAT